MMAIVDRKAERMKRHLRIRRKIKGADKRPRLCVTKSLNHIYVQLIDDLAGETVVSASTLDEAIRDEVTGCNIPAAEKLGTLVAARALEKGIESVVFDRGGYQYHGVVAALAESSRKGGLKF